jgi:hypothetical protein
MMSLNLNPSIVGSDNWGISTSVGPTSDWTDFSENILEN